ncbi:MAG: hypothetical protein LBH05_02915 [Deferribacteraceae bacterium]|nr:hypothetical protein [Deferribacteraceae bacterium]
MGGKVIRRIMPVFLILLLMCGSAVAQENSRERTTVSSGIVVNGLAALSSGDILVASVKAGLGNQLVVVSLRNCAETRRFLFDKEITGLTALKSDSGAVWGGQGDMLKKWNILDGKELLSVSAFPGEIIKGVSNDREGEYIAVWGNNKAALFKISGDNVTPVWAETATFRVSSVLTDPQGGHIYISGYDGSVVKRNMRGGMVNSFALEKPIYSMDMDYARQILLLAMGNGLLKLDINSTVFTRITSLPTDDIHLSGDGKILSALGGGVFTLYSYPAMKVTRTQNMKGDKFIVLSNGSSITFSENTLSFYDQKKQSPAGKVYILDFGTGFISPELDYYGNEHFRSFIADGKISGVSAFVAENRTPDMKACTALKEMVNSIYSPQTPAVAKPDVAKPAAPGTPATAASAETKTPAPIPKPAPLTPPTNTAPPAPPPSPASADTPAPKSATAVSGVQPPQMPVVKPVATPTLAQGTNIPSWAIRPNSQPAFSAVKSGRDGAKALTECKKKIRDDVARGVMKNMLDIELVKNLESSELKTRFVWQGGARTGQTASEYAMQKDVWVSQEGTYYVLAHIDSKNVDQIYEPIFQEEMKTLKSYGNDAYLKNEPIKWE